MGFTELERAADRGIAALAWYVLPRAIMVVLVICAISALLVAGGYAIGDAPVSFTVPKDSK